MTKALSLVNSFVLSMAMASAAVATPKEIVLGGGMTYPGHLQGTCTDGTMWIGSGCELKNPPPDANGKPQRLFGARAYPCPEFGQRAARHGIGG